MKKLYIYIKPFLDWKVLIIYLPIWFIVSGWTYVFIYLGTVHKITWMLTAGTSWAAFLWMPFTPEKLVTIPLCIYLYAKIFHTNSEAFDAMYKEAKKDWYNIKIWWKHSSYKFVRLLLLMIVVLIIIVIGGVHYGL